MGLIRVILAMSVFLYHMSPRFFGFYPIDGVTAVESFYVISGFYMSLILTERPEYRSVGKFLWKRWLRIWPVYFVVFLITAWMNYAIIDATRRELRTGPFLFMLFANVFIWGQDWIFFCEKTSDGGLAFKGAFANQENKAFPSLLLPQSWTLGIELCFYLIVPFIHRLKTPFVVLLTAVLLGVKWFFHDIAVQEPFNYRFFPFELPLFLYGFLGYRAYAQIKNYSFLKWLGWPVYLAVLVVTTGGQYMGFLGYVGIRPMPSSIPYIIAFTCPLIFLLTRRWKWDQKIGEFSYPIYLVHMLITTAVSRYLMPRFEWGKTSITAENNHIAHLVAVAGVIISSWLLIKLVIEPIDRYRAAS